MKMRKIASFFLSAVLWVGMVPFGAMADADNVEINETNFPDSNLRSFVSTTYDSNHDGVLSSNETKFVFEMNISEKGISSLQGVENFPSLLTLNCSYNSIPTIDLSGNPGLINLNCHCSDVTSLVVSGNERLTQIDCAGNDIASLDLSHNAALMHLYVNDNPITSLDLSNNTQLFYLDCGNDLLTSIDLSHNTMLQVLNISNYYLDSNTHVNSVARYNNSFTSIDLSNNTALRSLNAWRANLTELDLSNNTNLEFLYCNENNLTSIDLSKNTRVRVAYVSDNNLTSIDVSNNTRLESLYCSGNNIMFVDLTNTAVADIADCMVDDFTAVLTTDNIGVKQFIERIYTIALEREAEAAGVEFWIREALVNDRSGGDIARTFLFTDEFLNKSMSDEDFLRVVYSVFFNREADQAGIDYWLGEMSAKGKAQIIQEFINSQEWKNVCVSYGIASGAVTADPIVAFAERLYTSCLAREGEEGGITYWSNELRTGNCTGNYAASVFFFGNEFTNGNYSNYTFVERLYRTFFGRRADNAGRTYWIQQIEIYDASRRDVFNMFTGCQEWTDACAAAGIQP